MVMKVVREAKSFAKCLVKTINRFLGVYLSSGLSPLMSW